MWVGQVVVHVDCSVSGCSHQHGYVHSVATTHMHAWPQDRQLVEAVVCPKHDCRAPMTWKGTMKVCTTTKCQYQSPPYISCYYTNRGGGPSSTCYHNLHSVCIPTAVPHIVYITRRLLYIHISNTLRRHLLQDTSEDPPPSGMGGTTELGAGICHRRQHG